MRNRKKKSKTPEATQQQLVRAKIDLAQTTSENRNHWANADALAVRAAYSPAVRRVCRMRSRYEAENNSWYAGILRTASNHVVGMGPRLLVTGIDPVAAQRIQSLWVRWTKAVRFIDLLRACHETYWRDGEAFLVKHEPRRGVGKDAVPLDINLIEADQIASPYTAKLRDNTLDDGVRFDVAGNATEYYIYDNHPGDNVPVSTLDGEWYPADEVAHLFRYERSGQVRGVPRATPSLPTLPIMRRQEIATMLTAETAANFGMYLQTNSPQILPGVMPSDFLEIAIARNVLTTLPEGWTIGQVDPKQPGPSYEMFQRQALQSFSRCTNMPFHLAAGTGRDSNFSSMKGDIRQLWAPEVAVEQHRVELDVVSKVFGWFLDALVLVPNALDGVNRIEHIEDRWQWPPVPDVDPIDTASTVQLKLESGQSVPSDEYARKGEDFNEKIIQGAFDYGVTPLELRRAIFSKTFGIPPMSNEPPSAEQSADVASSSQTVAQEPQATTYMEIGQRSFLNNQKRIKQIVQDVIEGGSAVLARVLLRQIGLTDSDIDAILEDAADGVLDDSESEIESEA